MVDTDNISTVTLSGDLSVVRAAEIKDILFSALITATELHIKLTDVSDTDASFMQLICATHKSAHKRNLPMSIEVDPSAQIVNDVRHQGGFDRECLCFGDTERPCLWNGGTP